jgi:RNA polymerase sigma-B factor
VDERRGRGPAVGLGEKPADPVALFARWQLDHDHGARDELVRRFLPLARKLALRYVRASEPLDDLVQVATLGLLGAIDRFDPERGKSFSSFAVPTILGELRRHFRDHCRALHVPRAEQELALRVSAAEQELTARIGRSPTIEQLAELLELSIEAVCEGLEVNHANTRVSLDAPAGGDPADSDVSLGDTLGSIDDGYGLVETSSELAWALRQLPQREQYLLSLRFGQQLTQREIGQRIGVSQMQVSRLLRRALQRLWELSATQGGEAEQRAPRLPVRRARRGVAAG